MGEERWKKSTVGVADGKMVVDGMEGGPLNDCLDGAGSGSPWISYQRNGISLRTATKEF